MTGNAAGFFFLEKKKERRSKDHLTFVAAVLFLEKKIKIILYSFVLDKLQKLFIKTRDSTRKPEYHPDLFWTLTSFVSWELIGFMDIAHRKR